jgi:hypothetical protein
MLPTNYSKADLTPIMLRTMDLARKIADRLAPRDPRVQLIPVKAYHGRYRVEWRKAR